MTDLSVLVLFPITVGLLFTGGLIVWPVARRVGERQPDQLYWVPVSDPHSTGRQWVPVEPRPARVALPARLAGWWAWMDGS